MRLYITGCVGSGKSTLARRLSAATGISCTHLDEVMYESDSNDPRGNRKRNSQDRDALFAHLIAEKNWIIEDAGRECFRQGLEVSDRIIILDLPLPLLYFRVISRWLKQLFGIEKCIYRPTLQMLCNMILWGQRIRLFPIRQIFRKDNQIKKLIQYRRIHKRNELRTITPELKLLSVLLRYVVKGDGRDI